MLQAHMLAEGSRLSDALQRGLAGHKGSSSTGEEPCSPRSAFNELLGCLAQAEAQASALVGDGSATPQLSR